MRRKITFLIAALCALMLITQPREVKGQTRADYTIAFKSNSSNSDGNEITTTTVSDFVNSGTDKVASIEKSKVFLGKNGFGLKLGSSSAIGYVNMTLSEAGQVKATKIVFYAAKYGSDTGNIKITLNDDDKLIYTTSSLNQDVTEYEWTLASATDITKIKVETTSKRGYIHSVKVVYSSEPSISITSPVTLPATACSGTIDVTYADITPNANSSLALYSDNECSILIVGECWFSPAFKTTDLGTDYSKLEYTSSENDNTENTIYMKVTLSDGSKSVTSDPVTINQKALRTITYKPNGAIGSNIISKYSDGDDAEIASNTFTAPSGKMFLKWNTADNGSGADKRPGDIIEKIDTDIELYAIWADNYTITLNSNGMVSMVEVVQNGYYDLEMPNNVPSGYSFIGWAYDDEDPINTLVDSHYQVTANTQLYALYRASVFNKVTAEPSGADKWDGNYLIVYENENKAFDGSLETLDATYNTISVNITNNKIAYNSVTKNAIFSIANIKGTEYSIQSASGYYIGRATNSNGLDSNKLSSYSNTISLSNGNVTIKATVTRYLSFNTANDQKRFRYLSSGTVQLYKLELGDYTLSISNPTISGDIDITIPTTISSNQTFSGDVEITEALTIANGAVVTVSGTLTNTDPANLVIEDGGQLITNSCIPLTYKKNITSATKDGGWYTISTPVHTSSNTFLEHESVENLILAPEQYDFFYYDEPSHYWRNYKKHEFDLNVGQGYLYRNNGAELHFAGNNNQATYYEKDLSYASTEPSLLGFNLIGNPYPQNITMSDVTVNNEGTLTGGYVLSNAGAWSADVAATIAPAQGFLVQIDKAGVTARITKPTGGSKSRANHDYLKFIVANSQYEDAAFALFDKGYGLNKIDHRNADIPMLYIPKDKQNFAIATMSDDTKSFNLNFKAMTTGKYTLSYKATGTYSYLHVIDRLTGEDVDMLLEGEYSFIASPSDAENRFVVRLEYPAGSESPESSVFAYQSGNDIIVNGEGELQIFDMMGRMISTRRVTGVETIEKPSQTGVYIFKLNEKTQKIVVR